MTTTTHTPTPWTYKKEAHRLCTFTTIETESGRSIVGTTGYFSNRDGEVSGPCIREEDAAHIVRCVNAHDALVAALRTIAALSNAPTRHVDDYGDLARTALRDAGLEVAE